MDPMKAITETGEIFDEVQRHQIAIAEEAQAITVLWNGLGQANGQREDHAAAMLGSLRPHLEALEVFARRCREQITDMIRNPFEEGPDHDETQG